MNVLCIRISHIFSYLFCLLLWKYLSSVLSLFYFIFIKEFIVYIECKYVHLYTTKICISEIHIHFFNTNLVYRILCTNGKMDCLWTHLDEIKKNLCIIYIYGLEKLNSNRSTPTKAQWIFGRFYLFVYYFFYLFFFCQKSYRASCYFQ